MINKKELNLFLKASQEIGKNFIFTQGAGGNTSYKDGDSLFIKGSGLKLKDSMKKDIFIEVNLKKIVRNSALINLVLKKWAITSLKRQIQKKYKKGCINPIVLGTPSIPISEIINE